MKKVIFTLMIALFAVAAVTAQEPTDLTSKKGVPILPEKGDYAIGIDAIPFFNYFGNMFHGNNFSEGVPAFNFTTAHPLTIYGKYFKNANTAYRAYVRIGYNSETFKHLTTQDGSTTVPPATVVDKKTVSDMAFQIGAGLEKRRGKGRVQGIYGAEASLQIANKNMEKYTYGNSLSATTGTWWDFDPEFPQEMPNTIARPLKETAGMEFGLGVRAFVGVEYFFAPKISLGGEFGWGINFLTTGIGSMETEVWDGTAVSTIKTETAGGSEFHIDTDNLDGSINLLFYF
jgi:hypothetical protein